VRCGVTGTAEGEGLFKSTEVRRQVQMAPTNEPNVGEE